MDEPKLIKTLLSNKPTKLSVMLAVGFVLLSGVLSQMHWLGMVENWAANKVQFYNEGMLWQIFTATMIHGDWGHYLSNSYMLLILGLFVGAYYGPITFPLVTFGLAALTNALTILSYPDQVKLVGASGLVYVLAGFWLTMFWLVQRQHLWHRRLLRIVGVAAVILLPSTFEPNTSYLAHGIGFAVGVAYSGLYFFMNKEIIRSHEVWVQPVPDPELDLVDTPTFH